MIIGGLLGQSYQQAERAGGGVRLDMECNVYRSVVAQCAAAVHVVDVDVHGAAELSVGVSDDSLPIAMPEIKIGRWVLDGLRGVGTMESAYDGGCLFGENGSCVSRWIFE